MSFAGLKSMKPQMLLILIFISAVCYAQNGKDTAVFSKKNLPKGLSNPGEKRDTSQFSRRQFLLLNNIIFYTINLNFMDGTPKKLLSEEMEKIKLTPMQQAEENLKEAMKYIKVETEDKRSGWQKFLEDFLGIAKYVAVIALGIKTLIK